MSAIQRKGPHLSVEKRRKAIDEIIHFFDNERDEQIGNIAAEQVLNFFLEAVAPELYNQAIRETKAVLQNRLEELNYDLDDLLQ